MALLLTIVVLARVPYSKLEKRDVRAISMMRNVYQSYREIPECWDFSRMRKQSVPVREPGYEVSTGVALHNLIG